MASRRLSSLPLRVRLVAGFSATMLIVLAGAAGFVYWRVEYALDHGLDTELGQAARTLTPLVGPSGRMGDEAAANATGAAWQVIGTDGRVISAGGPAGAQPLVGPDTLGRVGSASLTTEVGGFLPRGDTPYRVRVSELPGSGFFLVAGVRRDQRDEALRELLLQLTIAVLAALVITSVVGDRLARAALEPVERYRARAASIAGGAAGLRLDVPSNRDDEVTRLGNTLNEMLTELERSIERERRFVDEASHELRTPLTLLKTRIQLTRRRSRTVTEHERVLDELATDVARLIDLAEQLLALGAAAEPAGGRGGVEVGRAVNAAASRYQSASVGRIVVDIPADSRIEAAVDPATLDRILTNLLDNALAHGRVPVTIRVRPSRHGRHAWVRLEVADCGHGMDADLLATAADRFTRSAEARARPGVGLGLSLVSGLVAQAGGELRLCSAGRHEHAGGGDSSVPCDHGPEMTATVVVPAVAGPV